nr:unnamed protein product [Digitaria exilis]
MFKFLKEVVAGSGSGLKDFPYTIGEPYASAWGSWVHHRGTSKVRHPNILSFLHSTEAEVPDGPAMKHTIYIVTEPVMPLSEKVKELNLGGTQRDEYFAWGLHQISKAVSFLNNDCKLVHGNVCLASVVVTQTLDWKLHAFDVLSEFDANNEASGSPMLQFEWLVGTQYKPMELTKSDWVSIRKSPPWAIDSWGLGCLIYELFSGAKLARTEDLRNTGSIPKSLLPDYQRLLNSTPSRRLNPSKLIDNSEFFQNKLVETIQFMEVLNLKDSVEKDSFFRKLPNIAEQLPREIVLKKLLPVLASSLEFGSAAAPALTVLLKMGSWLPADQFSIKVLPTIVKLFASNDRAIRACLLQHIDQFGESMSAQTVDEQVFPHVATGFSDTTVSIRELTLKSMLVLAPKLSQRTISGSLLKYLSKLQLTTGDNMVTESTGVQLKPGNAGLLGWAMSSITQKGKPADHGSISAVNASNSQVSATAAATPGTQASSVGYAPSTSSSLDQAAPASARSSVDGWGELEDGNVHEENGSDKEGWDDIDTFDDKPSPSLLSNIQAAQKRPVVQPKPAVKAPKSEDDPLWGPIAAAPPKSASKPADIKPSTSHNDDDDLWGAIAAPPPKSSGKPLKAAPAAANSDDLWGAIAAPPPATKARPLASSGRGRGTKPAQPKLGAQRIGRTSSTGM